MTFHGLDPDAVALLAKLPSLDARAFEKHRAVVAAGLVKPGAALIEQVAKALKVPLTVVPRSSVSPLHTDLRFARPGAPRYKDHLLLTAWHGADKKTAPTLWIRIDSTSVGFASGAPFTPAIRDRWREAVTGPRGPKLAHALEKILQLHAAHEAVIAGDQLKKVPPPWPADHACADLLRRTGLQVRFREPTPVDIRKPTFAEWCAKRLRDLLPVHRWLVAELYRRNES